MNRIVIKVDNFDYDLTIPSVKLKGLNYIDNLEFLALRNLQAEATSIASLMYEYNF